MVLSMELAQPVVPTVILVIMASVPPVLLPIITQVAVHALHAQLATTHQPVIVHAQFALQDVLNALMLAHVPLAQPITICHQTHAMPAVMAKSQLLAQLHARLAVIPTVKLVVLPQPPENVPPVMRLTISLQAVASLALIPTVMLALDLEPACVTLVPLVIL